MVYVKVGRAYVVVVVVAVVVASVLLVALDMYVVAVVVVAVFVIVVRIRLSPCGMEHSIFHLMKIIFHILTIVGMNTFIICIHYVLFSMLSQTGTIVNISRWEFQLTKEVLDFSN